MTAIGRHDLADDPELQDNPGRWERRDELDKAIGDWCAQHGSRNVVASLEAVGVPVGLIFRADDLVADDQLNARGMIQKLDVSTGDHDLPDVPFPGVVPVLDETSEPIRNLGPDLGEDTEDVLSRVAGWDDDQIRGYLQEALR